MLVPARRIAKDQWVLTSAIYKHGFETNIETQAGKKLDP